jgi:hypothetical protein
MDIPYGLAMGIINTQTSCLNFVVLAPFTREGVDIVQAEIAD